MTAQDRQRALAQWIRAVIAESIPLPGDISDYMTATFGTSDLASIIAEDATGEIDSLLELIFFPDIAIQIRFEAQWGQTVFTRKDRTTVQTLVCQTPLVSTLIPSPEGRSVQLTVPDFALQAFVQRLNITWQPAPQLVDTLTWRWPKMDADQIRVHLRNARVDWRIEQTDLVNHFLTKMPPDAEKTSIYLTFLLTILSELHVDTDPFDFLIAKKFFYFQSLCKAEDFERKRHTSNMEIIMLQGNRAAHGNVAQWRQQMQWIDHICHTLFGRTHFFQQPDEQSVDFQSEDNTQIMNDVIRTLS